MLCLGLGTGRGSALIVDGNLMPMELRQLSYKDSHRKSSGRVTAPPQSSRKN